MPRPRPQTALSLFVTAIGAVILGGLPACDRAPDIVVYTAPTDPPPPTPAASAMPHPLPGMATDTAVPAPDRSTLALTWDTPPKNAPSLSEETSGGSGDAGTSDTSGGGGEGEGKWIDTGQANQFRLTTLTVGQGDRRVQVAISRVPGPAGSITDNVNRWRRQLKLPPLSQEQMVSQVTYTQGTALPGMITDQHNGPRRALIAWFTLDHETWFFKATGTPDALDQHRAGFDALLASVRLNQNIPASDPHAGHDHD